MPVIQEGELRFTFPASIAVVRFDGESHGLSHCMKAVDFILEFDEFYLFVEVKDPDNSHVAPERRQQFAAQLTRSEFPRGMTQKYRDSFIYRWAEEKLDKPVRYVVLLQLSTLLSAELLAIDQALKQGLPISNTPSSWTRPVADGLAVMNMTQWNALGTYGTVQRV